MVQIDLTRYVDDRVVVPPLKGLRPDTAIARLRASHLEYGGKGVRESTTTNPAQARLEVTGSSPKEGARVRKGTRVTLQILSIVYVQDQVEVPDLRGRTMGSIAEDPAVVGKLKVQQRSGHVRTVTTHDPRKVGRIEVEVQSVPPTKVSGKKVPKGTVVEVTLVRYVGPPRPELIEIPALRGRGLAEARGILRARGMGEVRMLNDPSAGPVERSIPETPGRFPRGTPFVLVFPRKAPGPPPGPPPGQPLVMVPNVERDGRMPMSAMKARDILSRAGLDMVPILNGRRLPMNAPQMGRLVVWRQNPPQGTQVPRGSPVTCILGVPR